MEMWANIGIWNSGLWCRILADRKADRESSTICVTGWQARVRRTDAEPWLVRTHSQVDLK